MTFDTEYGIRWTVKPWGPLNKTGRLENAPPMRTLELARMEREGIVSSIDFHFHDCPYCKHIWSHKRSEIPDGQFDKAHTCPKCNAGADYIARRSIREIMEDRVRWAKPPIWSRFIIWLKAFFNP